MSGSGVQAPVADETKVPANDVSIGVRRLVQLAVAAAVAVQVVPIWLTTRFPDQDGPAHLASSVAISGAYHGAAATTLHTYVRLELGLGHNPLGHLLLAGLVRTTGALAGQRLFLSLYLLAFAAAGWYAMSAVRGRTGALVTLLLPVGSGYFLLLGFWDFLLSLVGSLLVIGYWLRHHDDPGRAKYLWVAGLLLLTSLLHPSGIIVGVSFVGLVAVIDATGGPRARAVVGVGATALACIPAFVPAALVSANASGSTPRPPLVHNLRGLVGLTSVVRVMHSSKEAVLTIALVVLLVAFVGVAAKTRLARRRLVATDALLAVAVACAVASLVAPNATGGAELLNERLALFAVVTVVIWLGTQPVSERVRTGIAVVGAVIAIALVAVRIPTYRSLDRSLREITSVESAMVSGRTYVVVLGQDTTQVDRLTAPLRSDPFRSVTGYFAADRKLVGLDNYEGRYNYFPYQYVAARDPVRGLFLVTDPRAFNRHPPLDIAGYERRTGSEVDYVVVLGPPDRALRAQLGAKYRVVAVSKPTALATVFSRVG